jgi:hypothetical protein
VSKLDDDSLTIFAQPSCGLENIVLYDDRRLSPQVAKSAAIGSHWYTWVLEPISSDLGKSMDSSATSGHKATSKPL